MRLLPGNVIGEGGPGLFINTPLGRLTLGRPGGKDVSPIHWLGPVMADSPFRLEECTEWNRNRYKA